MDKYTYDVLRDIAKQLYTLNTQINLLGQTLLTQNEILVAIGKSLVTYQEKMEDEQNGKNNNG